MKPVKCPHPNCQRYMHSGMYACWEHWFSIPEKTRKKLWLGQRQKSTTLWCEGHKEALENWRQVAQS